MNEFTDNNGTIIKIDENGTHIYDIYVGQNIPEGESIIDYCYYQHEESLVQKRNEANIPEWSFCSGTCTAMILAITRGDSSIKPADVIYWDNSKLDDGSSEINWCDSGLKDWEREIDGVMISGGKHTQ